MQMQMQMQRRMADGNRQGAPGGPGMSGMAGGPGMPGGPGGFNAPGGSNAPANFHSPEGAVTAFLNALKAKDLDRLSEAIAIRAPIEATAKNRDIFQRIYDGNLSESELDELARKMEGYQIAGENPAKSSGRVQVLLRKANANNAGWSTRLVVVRHEKKGWGVCDVLGEAVYKSPRMTLPGRRNAGGGGYGKGGGP
jgi:hypothetical protein